MRLFWRIIFISIGFAAFAMLWMTFKPAIWIDERSDHQEYISSQPKNQKVRIAYELDDEKWVSFSLSANDEVIKVVSNAEIPADYQALDDEHWVYGIEYQIVDNQDQPVLSGDIFHNTGQKIFYDEVLKESYVSTSFYPPLSNPVDARLHIINLRGYESAKKIRLREKYKQQPVIGVIARIYHQEKIANHKLKYLWQRMGVDKKDYLARASIYDADLLRERERLLLMEKQWTHLAPLGVSEKDYVARKLYVARDVEEDVVTNLPVVPPTGLVVYPDRFGIIRIPVFPGTVKVTWQSITAAGNKDKVNIEWWGHPVTRYKQWQRNLKSGEFSEKIDSGVIQVSTTSEAVFRVWINVDKQAVEITPDTKYARLYQSAQQPVIFNVNHSSIENTQIRIDLRTFVDTGDAQVKYRLIDQDNQIVKQGMIEVAAIGSRSDTVTADEYRIISNPQSYFFNLPAAISRIELNSEEEVWASAYTRPSGMALSVSYPYQQENTENNSSSLPAWYFLRPANWKDYVAKGRSLLLITQPSAPEVDPLIKAGQYRWDQFLPEGNWRGRELLTAVVDGLPYREQSIDNRYAQLELSTDTVVDLLGRHGEPVISPQLMYIKEDANETEIKLWLDNKLILHEKVFAVDGEIRLPPISPGRHTLKVEANQKVKFFLDHVAKQENSFVKKMAIKLDKEPLIFSYLKEHDEELIAIRIYTKQDHDLTQEIELNVAGIEHRSIGPFKSWTFTDRLYQLNETDGTVARVLKSKDPDYGPARLFFVALGDDLPNGKQYQIKMKLLSGSTGFVVLTRTLPGDYESRVIRNEKSILNN